MKKILAALVLFCLVLPDAFAWGRQGHRMVALVAADHLTPVAAQNVRALLGRETMAEVASYADDYRSEHPETAPWHFVDIPIDQKTYVRERDCPAPSSGGSPDLTAKWRDCVVDRIPYFVTMLKDPAAKRGEQIFALKMLIHLVGDVHQPLHAIGEARGGNGIRVTEFGTTRCETSTCNLHGTWDEGLIEHARMTEKKYVAMLEDEIVVLKLADKPVGTPVAWANASHRVAVEAWVPNGGVINEEYYKAEIPVVNRELELGGLHLADLLNAVFVTAPPTQE